ncbi:hypothetical protein CBL_04832 [Carabus blaptoides fortunei]
MPSILKFLVRKKNVLLSARCNGSVYVRVGMRVLRVYYQTGSDRNIVRDSETHNRLSSPFANSGYRCQSANGNLVCYKQAGLLGIPTMRQSVQCSLVWSYWYDVFLTARIICNRNNSRNERLSDARILIISCRLANFKLHIDRDGFSVIMRKVKDEQYETPVLEGIALGINSKYPKTNYNVNIWLGSYQPLPNR